MRNVSLSIESAKYTLLQKRLLEQWPTLEEDVVSDTLEGITDLHDMIAGVIRSALADEAKRTALPSFCPGPNRCFARGRGGAVAGLRSVALGQAKGRGSRAFSHGSTPDDY